MKIRIITYSLSIIMTLIFVSCDDFLSKDPDPRASLDTPQAVSELLVSAYPEVTYYQFLEVMSDNAGDVRLWYENAVNTSVEQAYWWRNVNSYNQDTPWGYWMACYEAIAAANHALEAIEKINEKDRDNFRAQRAEALICRAYSHFMLVNIFSKTYNANTASTDLGVPYVTKPEKVIFGKYDRGNVADVYKNIEADLQEGLKDIALNSYSVPRYHFNPEATYAFATRYYLFKNEPDSVIKYADLCIGTNPASKLRDLNGPKYNGQVYKVIEATYTDSAEPCNLLLASTVSSFSRSPFHRYKLTPRIKSEIYDRSVTGGSLVYPFYTYALGDRTIHTPKFKEWFKQESVNANYGQAYIMSILFTNDEVLLNRAEAYVMKNMIAEAYKDLNTFYSKRVDNYNSSQHVVNQTKVDNFAAGLPQELDPYYGIPAANMNLMKVIVDTRRKEFIMEGLRWFDIKRFNFQIEHSDVDKHTVILAKDSPLQQIQIPLQAISSGLKPNPGRD